MRLGIKRRSTPNIVLDAREFIPGTMTGIGRFLFGLVRAFLYQEPQIRLTLAIGDESEASSDLAQDRRVSLVRLPSVFVSAERTLSAMTNRECDLFISPYPKLPAFPIKCPAINTVHDVHDLTHPVYRHRFKSWVDRFRVQASIFRTDLTWFDSRFSLEQARRIFIVPLSKAIVRHLAIDGRFDPAQRPEDATIFEQYGLPRGYILVLGNGLPHKNLGALLTVANELKRPLVLAGVSRQRMAYWWQRFPETRALWVEQVADKDLPSLMRNAFCLALPSTAEGYGYPPLEAMACGIPAIISKLSVLKETAGDGAIYVESGDSTQWRKTIEALEDKVLYREARSRGLAWVCNLVGDRGWRHHVADAVFLMKKSMSYPHKKKG